jgi:hypothetical protein
MFSVKGFAAGKNATPYSGSAAAAIMDSNIVASIAAPKRAVSSDELQTSATEKLWKEGWINATDSARIASGVQHFPLWIIPPAFPLLIFAGNSGKQHEPGVPYCIICGRPGRFVNPFQLRR